jgi:acyl-CoA dehydrogenase
MTPQPTAPASGAAGLAAGLRPLFAERAGRVDTAGDFPADNLDALRASGLMGLLVPTGYGGGGGGVGDLAEAARIMAGGCLSTAMIWAMHCQQVDALVRHATPELRDELLPRVARGEVYIASVTTEAGKGGRLTSAEAALEHTGATLALHRDAPVVTGGEHADGYLVTMREAPDAPDSRVSLVYADRDLTKTEVYGSWNALGMRGTRSVGMRLSANVPVRNVVGGPGAFRAVATDSMIAVGHIAWAACWLGAAQSAFGQVVSLLRSPNRPRSVDPRSDLTTERLGRTRMDLDLVGAYLHQVTAEVARHREQGLSIDTPPVQIHLNTLKVTAAELTYAAVDRLVQLCGLSVGYSKDSAVPLERHLRDLRSAALNYSNDRLLTATGSLALLDRSVRLA